jgi:tRNA A-37 threonylcarbamoyl transferase component Bud32
MWTCTHCSHSNLAAATACASCASLRTTSDRSMSGDRTQADAHPQPQRSSDPERSMSGDRTKAEASAPASDLMRPGLRVGGDGRYELLSKLGEGGMGSVWRARDLKLTREVAIKRIRGATSPALQERFLRETRALTGLSHPNVVTVFDAGEDSYGNYLVMELVSGKTLAQRLKEGPIEASQSVDLFCAMCRGMSHAHKRGVVHRDLKPSNVMLNDDGVARILDFGLVRLEGSGDLSLTGVGMGTLDYASPEQKQDGGAADERSDVFALGLVFYEMLTGRRPSPMHLHKIERPWRDVLERATEPEPDQRYRSMDEMLAEAESAKVTLNHEAVMTQAMGKDDDLRCPKCRLVNTLEAKFCRSCRESLRQMCPACNAQVRTGLKHCDQCTADIKFVHECRAVLAAVPQKLLEGRVREAVSAVQSLQQRMRAGVLGDAGDEIGDAAQSALQKCGEQAKKGRELARRAADLEKAASFEEAQMIWREVAKADVDLAIQAAECDARLAASRSAEGAAKAWQEGEFEEALVMLRDAARLDKKWAAALVSREAESSALIAARDHARAFVGRLRVVAMEARKKNDFAAMAAAIEQVWPVMKNAGSRFESEQAWAAEVERLIIAERVRLNMQALQLARHRLLMIVVLLVVMFVYWACYW